MSIDFHPPRLAQGLLGAALWIGVGWLSLTSAAGRDPAGASALGATQDALESIVVERHRPPPAWRVEMEERLELRITVDAESAPIEDVVSQLRESTGLNFVLQAQAFHDLGIGDVTIELADVSVRAVLDRLCEPTDVAWCLAREAVCIGWAGDLPEELDLRFYKVAPLLAKLPDELREDALSSLLSLVHETALVADAAEWTREGVWIETWEDLLVVHQTDAMHARMLALLNRLLNRGRAPHAPSPAWRIDLEERLAATIDVDVAETSAEELVTELARATGVRIRFDQDTLDAMGGEPLALELADVSLATALGWIAHWTRSRVQLRPGEVVLGQASEQELVFHDVGDLFGSVHEPSDDDLRDRVESTIRHLVLPESWHETPGGLITYWDDQMLVVQCAEAQEQIAALLDAVRRATRS